MAEQIIHSILLALHNIALVGCAAAPFYNRALVTKRGQYGPKLDYKLDKVVEDTLQGNAPYCMAFIAILWFTGLGMPLNHYAFQGAFHSLHPVGMAALGLKLASLLGMMIIMFIIFFQINPRLRELFSSFTPDAGPDPEKEREFFAKRARRKGLCEICLYFALTILVCSAFLGFGA
ncbi:MAG: hypothetical protein GXP54_03290 [Deltaproteobacteria bacterium]|nr:hypothetical protein [Deltaproteobacteria bacterium]